MNRQNDVHQSLKHELESMIHLHTIGKYNNMDDVRHYFKMKFMGLMIIISLILLAIIIVLLSSPPFITLFFTIETPSLYALSHIMDITLAIILYSVVICHEYGRYQDGYEREIKGIRSIFVIIRPRLLDAHEHAVIHLQHEKIQALSWKNRHTVTIGEIIDFVDEYNNI